MPGFDTDDTFSARSISTHRPDGDGLKWVLMMKRKLLLFCGGVVGVVVPRSYVTWVRTVQYVTSCHHQVLSRTRTMMDLNNVRLIVRLSSNQDKVQHKLGTSSSVDLDLDLDLELVPVPVRDERTGSQLGRSVLVLDSKCI